MTTESSAVPLLDLAKTHAALREDLLAALARVVDDGRFLFGPDVVQLEKDVAQLSQAQHGIGCASGSDALLLSLLALGIGPGDEVIVPSFTFFATVSAVVRVGAKPVMVDILPDTYNINPAACEAAITSRTRAIIPVHLFGQCAAMDKICQLGDRHGIAIIEDAAQAIGAAYHSRPAGNWGTIGCFSFYPTKNLGGMGDGGMLTTNDDALADRIRLFAAHGMKPRYYHRVVGINSRLDSFQAAVLRVKFARLGQATQQRKQVAANYDRLFAEQHLDQRVTLPKVDPAAYHVWNQYGIRVPGGKRDALREHLQQRKIGTEVYYPLPLHKQECFQDVPMKICEMRETERACEEILHLPIYPGLEIDAQSRVVEAIANFYAVAKRAAA
jgi:dTDP-4-amino-4,6-dideoxygalactose transaminase